MLDIHSETNVDECRRLWEQFIPPHHLTDLWDVRTCFHRYFNRKLLFVVAKEAGRTVGFIPLSWIPENNYYGYFPGEVWGGKTWLEQNRLMARDKDVLAGMLDWLNRQKIQFHLRYLLSDPHLPPDLSVVDEIGYLFCPPPLRYDIDKYFGLFSRKSEKAIRREVGRFYERDLTVRLDEFADFDLMVRMNVERFGTYSYFAEERFTASFRQLACFLREKGWLKITAFIIEGTPAAVDMGAVYNGVYTLLAGGTHAGYPGIAKVINLHHMKKSCEERYREADFLCGDFSWKKIFHLSPRPLYLISNITEGHHVKSQESVGCGNDGGLC